MRVAQWISTVNQNFEPSEQETVIKESCVISPETEFDSIIDEYVQNARIGTEVPAPRRTTRDDYVPLLPAANYKNLTATTEDNVKPKAISSAERIKSPESTSQVSSSLTNTTSCMAPIPNISPRSSLLHSQRSPVENLNCGTGRLCKTSPPVSCSGISNSSPTFSKNLIGLDTSEVNVAASQQREFRSPLALHSSLKEDTNLGFFKPRDTSPTAPPVNRVLCGTSVPMMVDSNPVVNSENENINRSSVIDSSGTNIPSKPALSSINYSNSSVTPGCASVDSGCVSFSEETVGMEIDYNEELEAQIKQEVSV